MHRRDLLATFVFVLLFTTSAGAAEKLKVMILDGQNNHDWKRTTPVMKAALEQTGRFEVDVVTSPPGGSDLSGFRPKFSDYGAVISNYNGQPWSKETQQALVDYVRGGGGFVVVHAADNAFGDWKEYNEMIGLGGWGGRNEKSGPYVYIKDDKIVRDEAKGGGGSHGRQHAFQIVVRKSDHPITRGMPKAWMHAQDELYALLRGPATHMTLLATTYADPSTGGTGRHEPMLLTIDYGKGRVFHTPMGHADYSMKCVGFITCLARGTEWAATGEVTLPIPDDFPTPSEVRTRDPVAQAARKQQHIVFVTGDEEYRSEESMPMLARMLEQNHGFKCTVLFALDPDGTINPDNVRNIAGLEALEDADLMVMFTRFRQLPDDQLEKILAYTNSGKPMVGFRTSTHAFRYGGDNPNGQYNNKFGREVFGQRWITHHGHLGDRYLTEAKLVDEQSGHSVLRGVEPFKCYSWLYHVHGGSHQLYGDCKPLLTGTSLVSNHERGGRMDQFPLTNPVAWTKTYTGSSGKTARVFFTTLGHPHDFKAEAMRRLAINGMYWALGREAEIPAGGAKAELVGEFDLTNAGFGGYIKGVKPAERYASKY